MSKNIATNILEAYLFLTKYRVNKTERSINSIRLFADEESQNIKNYIQKFVILISNYLYSANCNMYHKFSIWAPLVTLQIISRQYSNTLPVLWIALLLLSSIVKSSRFCCLKLLHPKSHTVPVRKILSKFRSKVEH